MSTCLGGINVRIKKPADKKSTDKKGKRQMDNSFSRKMNKQKGLTNKPTEIQLIREKRRVEVREVWTIMT